MNSDPATWPGRCPSGHWLIPVLVCSDAHTCWVWEHMGLTSFLTQGGRPCGVEGLAWFYPKVKWGAWLHVGTTSVSEMGILVGSGSSLLSPLGIGDDRERGPAFPAINYASRSDGSVERCEHVEQRAGSLLQPGSGSCAIYGLLVSACSSRNGGCWWAHGGLETKWEHGVNSWKSMAAEPQSGCFLFRCSRLFPSAPHLLHPKLLLVHGASLVPLSKVEVRSDRSSLRGQCASRRSPFFHMSRANTHTCSLVRDTHIYVYIHTTYSHRDRHSHAHTLRHVQTHRHRHTLRHTHTDTETHRDRHAHTHTLRHVQTQTHT